MLSTAHDTADAILAFLRERALHADLALDEVVLVDQEPIGRTPRSNPVTYIKAFDEIRAVFADTVEARARNHPNVLNNR